MQGVGVARIRVPGGHVRREAAISETEFRLPTAIFIAFGFRIELRSDICRALGKPESECRWARSPRGCYFRDHDTCARRGVAIREATINKEKLLTNLKNLNLNPSHVA